jgi:hypothetical protein
MMTIIRKRTIINSWNQKVVLMLNSKIIKTYINGFNTKEVVNPPQHLSNNAIIY